MLCVVFHVFVQLMNKTSEQFVGSCILNVINRDMKCKKKRFAIIITYWQIIMLLAELKVIVESKLVQCCDLTKKSKLNYKQFDIITF